MNRTLTLVCAVVTLIGTIFIGWRWITVDQWAPLRLQGLYNVFHAASFTLLAVAFAYCFIFWHEHHARSRRGVSRQVYELL
jgi:hypothetical protein